jgi:hypothetical protein
MIPSGLLVALALTGGEVLAPTTLLGLSFRAPASWEKSSPDEHSVEWTAAHDMAKLAVSAFPLEKLQTSAGCMKKLLDAVGKGGFETMTLGTQPAAKKITSDFVGEGERAKVEANRVTTTTIIGCNGKMKWVMTWSARTSEAARFGPMLRRIIESISYGKTP